MWLQKARVLLCVVVGIATVDAHREVVIAIDNAWEYDITLRLSAFDGGNFYHVECCKGYEMLIPVEIPDEKCVHLAFGIAGIEGCEGSGGKAVFEEWYEDTPATCNVLRVKTNNFLTRSFLYEASMVLFPLSKTPEPFSVFEAAENISGGRGSAVATVSPNYVRRTSIDDFMTENGGDVAHDGTASDEDATAMQ